jgi:hypothetical protein
MRAAGQPVKNPLLRLMRKPCGFFVREIFGAKNVHKNAQAMQTYR